MKATHKTIGICGMKALVIAGLAAASLPGANAAPQAVIEVRTTVQSVNDFREPLAEHGRWLDTEEYGMAWRPNVAADDASWRPYCHGGYWMWTDRGWYWQSTYVWGWAPFHYGRWTLTRAGWLWVPDTIWSPGHVEWRRTGSHVGWAPVWAVPRETSRVSLTFGRGGISFGLEVSDEDRFCFVPEIYLPSREVVAYVAPYEERSVIYRQSVSTVYVIRDDPRRGRGDDDWRNEPRWHGGHYRRDPERWNRSDGDTRPQRPPAVNEPPRSTFVNPGRRSDALQRIVTRDRPPAAAATPGVGTRNPGSRSGALMNVASPAPAPAAPAPTRVESSSAREPAAQIRTSGMPSSRALDDFRRRMRGE